MGNEAVNTQTECIRISVAGVCRVDGLYFVAKRVEGGSLGGKWEFPGGKVEEGETPEQALAREYGEEFGARIEVDRFVCETGFSNCGKRYRLLTYFVRFTSPLLNHPEHAETAWIERADLDRLDLADSDRAIVSFLE